MKTAVQMRAETAQRRSDRIARDLALLDARFEEQSNQEPGETTLIPLWSNSVDWAACEESVDMFCKILTEQGYHIGFRTGRWLEVRWDE